MSEPATLCIVGHTPRGEHGDELPSGGMRGLVESIAGNPWARLDEMMFSGRGDRAWQAVDVDAALAELGRRGGHMIFREGRGSPAIEGQVMDLVRVSAGVYVPEARFGAQGRAHAREVLVKALSHLPASASGTVFVDAMAEAFQVEPWFAKHGITPLPRTLEGLPWLVAVPVEDAPHLVSAAGVAVEQRDGRVWLQLYDDPFAFDTPAARDRIARISAYLARAGVR